MRGRPGLRAAWGAVLAVAIGVRIWNALAGPRMWGYDAWGHVAYVLFLDLYRAVPWADQGWSYFHPPLHYALGWALAQFGSGEVLMRGLALLASAASLGTAALAAWLVRVTAPSRPWLALLGFGAVALLPVHLFMSPMPGNELTETFLTAAGFCAFVANERRSRPTVAGAAGAGALLGLALLTKFSGLVPLLALLAALGLRQLLEAPRRPLGPVALRGAVLAGVALALAAPYYARNIATFGNPFELSRGYPLVASVEKDQPPGARDWSHYFKFPLKAFSDPNPLAPHLLDSVWASVYLNVWADTYRESDVERSLEAERQTKRSTSLVAVLGLLPTALAFAGAGLVLRDVARGIRRDVYVPVLLLAGASLGAFTLFTWEVPLWSALKASYLLPLSLPFAVFLARGVEALADRGHPLAPALALAGIAATTATVATAGAVQPRRADAPATGAVRFYFGEYEEARRIYGRLILGSGYPVAWLENLAAVEIGDGRPDKARRLYARALSLAEASGRSAPQRPGRLAVAVALDGDLAEARRLLDDALAARPRPELRANRGAIRAAEGDAGGAEEDLRAALAEAPEMLPAWLNLARVLGLGGHSGEAREAAAHAATAACHGPRGYPYGLGTGEVIEWGVARRPLLLVEDDGRLRFADIGFRRTACRRLRRAAEAQ